MHTVGPRYSSGSKKELRELEKCYENILSKAIELKMESIGIPLISTGAFGFPKKKAFKVAINTITDFLYDNDFYVYLLVYDNESFDISRKLYHDIKDYLSDYGFKLDERVNVIGGKSVKEELDYARAYMPPKTLKVSFLDGYKEDESFNECLRRHIKEKELFEKDVYKNANLTKQAFNGIYNENYIPKKGNALALAIGLKLDIDETIDFIEKAGYSFGRTKQDYIVKYFIENERYDIYELNEFLLSQDLPYLGSKYE